MNTQGLPMYVKGRSTHVDVCGQGTNMDVCGRGNPMDANGQSIYMNLHGQSTHMDVYMDREFPQMCTDRAYTWKRTHSRLYTGTYMETFNGESNSYQRPLMPEIDLLRPLKLKQHKDSFSSLINWYRCVNDILVADDFCRRQTICRYVDTAASFTRGYNHLWPEREKEREREKF